MSNNKITSIDDLPPFTQTESISSIDDLPPFETVGDVAPQPTFLPEGAVDFAKGAIQGVTLGGADELTAAAVAAYKKLNPSTSEEEASSFGDLYRQKQQEIQRGFEESQERSPWLYTGGQVVGGITSGSALGGLLGVGKAATSAKPLMDIVKNEGKLKALTELGIRGAKTYKEALPIIATEAALSSEKGGLTSIDEAKQLGEDILGGAAFALPATVGLQAVTDAALPALRGTAQNIKGRAQDIVADTPLLRQMKVAYGYGTEGINPKAQTKTLATDLGNIGLTGLDDARTYKLRDEILGVQKKLGQGVGSSLENNPTLVNIDPQIKETLKNIEGIVAQHPDLMENARAQQIFRRIAEGQTELPATDAKGILDDIDTYIKRFTGSRTLTRAEEGVLKTLYEARKSFSNTLKIQIPEYAIANKRFAEFMKLVPESLIGNTIFDEMGNPVQISRKFFGEMNDSDKALFNEIKKLMQGTTREGSATQPIRERFVNAIKGLKTFEQREADRLARGEISEMAFNRPAREIEEQIKKFSDDAVTRGAVDALEPHTGVATTLAKTLTGTGETGRAMSLSAANVAGRVTRKISSSTTQNPVSKVVKNVYTAPNETVLALSQKLKASPTLQKYGQALEDALNSPDSNRRNQVLFTIMQNPNARAFVNEETSNPQEEQNPGSYTPMP